MPIHRHHASSETVVILRGKIEWNFFDDNDNLNPNKPTEVVILDANGEPRMLNVERNRWHSLVCLESGSVLYESKDGAYQPLTPDEIMEFPAYEGINDTDSRYLDKKQGQVQELKVTSI